MSEELKSWWVTPWTIKDGSWGQQPIIVIEGKTPFFADHPSKYVRYLRDMHEDKELMRGPFWAMIGQFKDVEENNWGK